MKLDLINSCNANINTNDKENCQKLMSLISTRRSIYPATYWDDKDYGRLTSWDNVL